jgi:uncharacterized protein
MTDIECVRVFDELRSAADGRKIIGYPIVFNALSQDLGGFRELIRPGAVQFDDDVRADFNHEANRILGRVSAGTLTLSIDSRGVKMECTPPNAVWADDLLVSMRRGDINQGSFAFRVLPGGEQYTTGGNGEQIRTLTRILVRKVSVVSDPAYPTTAIAVRSRPSPQPERFIHKPASGQEQLELMRRVLSLSERL